MRHAIPIPLLVLSLALVTTTSAHLIPTVSVSSHFDDASASFQLDLDLRLARDGQPIPPSTLLDGPGGQAERDALLALARAFIDEHLLFLFDDQPLPLEWSLEIYDPQEEGAPAAENQLHVLANATLSPPPGTSSFRLRAGPELPASLILINHRDGVAARRANVLFAGEASRPFAYSSAPHPGGTIPAAPIPTSTWRPPAVFHGLSLALQPFPALLAIAFALTLRGPALLLYPFTFALGLQLPSLLPAVRSLALPDPATLLFIALALTALAALLPPISLRPPPATTSPQTGPVPPTVPPKALALFIAPALLITAAAAAQLTRLPGAVALHAAPATATFPLPTTLAAAFSLMILALAASFTLTPLHRTHATARRAIALALALVGFALYLSPSFGNGLAL